VVLVSQAYGLLDGRWHCKLRKEEEKREGEKGTRRREKGRKNFAPRRYVFYTFVVSPQSCLNSSTLPKNELLQPKRI